MGLAALLWKEKEKSQPRLLARVVSLGQHPTLHTRGLLLLTLPFAHNTPCAPLHSPSDRKCSPRRAGAYLALALA